MTKYFFIALLLGTIMLSPAVGRAEEGQTAETVAQTNVEAGVEAPANPGMLPTSPWYFLKEWRRVIQQALITDSVAKAEFEVKVSDEKAAEAKKVQEVSPQNTQGIKRALENYRRSQDRLKARLEQLKETSNNPNVDALLTKVSDRVVAHEQMFEGMQDKLKDAEGAEKAQDTFDSMREKAREIMGNVAKKDTPEQFKNRMENSLSNPADGKRVDALRAFEFVNTVKEKVPAVMKEQMEQLRTKIGERVQDDIVKTVLEQGIEKLKESVENMPGTAAQKLKALENLRLKAKTGVAPLIDRMKAPLEKQEAAKPVQVQPVQ
ncbi:MAG: hypothetical protein HYW98_00600 [Candidatus Wildermuthbacteria bacterium]|nr:hypothetical protein [Candidatus Wildermuthbacteria bacterium]